MEIRITEYREEYAKEMSDIIVKNLLEVNSKDYGIEYAKKQAEEFSVEKIKETFPKRTKVFVALDGEKVVGTAGLDKSWYSDDGEYYILTVFVDVNYHKLGIGKMLIRKIEEYAKEIKAKRLVIPASIFGCEFYRKLGYEYVNGEKVLNEEKMYMLEKNEL